MITINPRTYVTYKNNIKSVFFKVGGIYRTHGGQKPSHCNQYCRFNIGK